MKMPSCCAVFGCKNISGRIEGLVFHRFPKNEKRRKVWIQFCKRKDQLNADSGVICSQHFEPEAYQRDLRNELLGLPVRKLLIPNAIPTIFDGSARTTSGNTNTARNGRLEERERRKLIEELLRDHGDNDDPHIPENDVEQKPETVKVKKKRSLFRRCLLCLDRFDQNTSLRTSEYQIQNQSNHSVPLILPVPSMSAPVDEDSELGENLRKIFALKNIFNFDSTDLIKFMKVSKGKNPREWYHLCGECLEIMKKAVALQRQILELTRDLEKCKRQMQQKVKQSCETELDKPERKKGDLMVSHLIRESIYSQLKRTGTSATEVENCDEVKVKTEPVDTDDAFGDFSNFVDVESQQELIMNSSHSHDTFDAVAVGKLRPILGKPMKPRKFRRKQKQAMCENCGKNVRQFQLPLHNLRAHGIVMDGCSEFKCPNEGCKYTTIYNHHLQKHISIVHAPEKSRNYVCKFCGREFKCSGHLKRHENLHENAGLKPYQCELCGSCFSVSSYLRTHYTRFHLRLRKRKPYHQRRNRIKALKRKTSETDAKPSGLFLFHTSSAGTESNNFV